MGDDKKKRRSTLKGMLTKVEKFIAEMRGKPVEPEAIQVRIERLDELLKEFNTIQFEIEDGSTDIDVEHKEREGFEERACVCKTKLLSALNATKRGAGTVLVEQGELGASLKLLAESQININSLLEKLAISGNANVTDSSQGGAQTSTVVPLMQAEVKLPTIQAPNFDGDYKDWPTFRDLFSALVGNKVTLTNSQKLQYLKSALRGEAALVLKHISICDANYEEAWKELESKYDKKRVIIDAHLRSIMEQPVLNMPNYNGFKKLCSTIMENYRALKALKRPVDSWDDWLIFVVTNKLDSESRQLWARASASLSEEEVKFSRFSEFLMDREHELQSMQPIIKRNYTREQRNITMTTVTLHQCICCDANHKLWECEEFKKLNIQKRREIVKAQNICYNCLNATHRVKFCKFNSCKLCKGRHHSLLHENRTEDSSPSSNFKEGVALQPIKTPHCLNVQMRRNTRATLPTAVVRIRNCNGYFENGRALLDSGSEVTIVSEALVQRLGLSRGYNKTQILGLGSCLAQTSRGCVYLTVRSRFSKEEVRTRAIIVGKLTSHLPTKRFEVDHDEMQIKELQLADPNFNEPSTVDVIFGADIFFNVLKDGQIRWARGNLLAQNTIFGYIIGGSHHSMHRITTLHCVEMMDELLQHFWKVEDFQPNSFCTEEEQSCEAHFLETHKRRSDGSYEVQLPFKKDHKELGETRKMATSRLRAINQKFESNPDLKSQYVSFMYEYEKLGHMKEIKNGDTIKYILPHHAVIKPSSSTTKLRVVFDASAKSSNGISLNDVLLGGAVIQPDLRTILLRFRRFPIAYCADIAKMYRQIWMAESDTHYQTILWQPTPKHTIKEYALQTLTYGTKPASFLATRVLQQLAKDEEMNHKVGAKVLRNSFYMDDFMSGSMSIEEAVEEIEDISNILRRGNFDLRKWTSNSVEILQRIPESKRETNIVAIDEGCMIKTLGLYWNPRDDFFTFKVQVNNNGAHTKRSVLSDMARLYDPFGYVAPVIVRAKIFMQNLWMLGIDWNDSLPLHLQEQWCNFQSDLLDLEGVQVPRWMQYTKSSLELHAYADASERAYGAVVYCRVKYEDGYKTSLIAAKTKVAPVRQVSLPRLELCAAHLLAKLMSSIRVALDIKDIGCYAWTDSTIVLCWLADHPTRWKTFVANRVSAILELLPSVPWYHVESASNPADCASRGLKAKDLLQHKLWWSGPEVLQGEVFPSSKYNSTRTTNLEERHDKPIVLTSTVNEEKADFIESFESLTELKRVTAICMRFIQYLRKGHSLSDEILTPSELSNALTIWIKKAQLAHFKREIESIGQGKPLAKTSKLIALSPILDEAGVLRVGGRLQNSTLSYDAKHPIIIPKGQTLSKLIVSDLHVRHLHAGQRLLMNLIFQKFWIIGARNVARKHIRNCIECIRHRGKTSVQLMGNLPACRVEVSKPFSSTGVDYAGPITIRAWKGRGSKQTKGYIAVFVCMATKGIHLEAVSDLTTDSFLAALNRFTSRRGHCAHIYSDNATNFIGADRALKEVQQLISSKEHNKKIADVLSPFNTCWHFIPPAAPNMGGLWEAAVKTVKFHLKRVLGSAILTFEEMATVLCKIEACVNSRPLGVVSTNEDCLDALTPGHLMIGRPILAIPEPDRVETKVNSLGRWQYLQHLSQTFWRRWQGEYLATLQRRQKWSQKLDDIQPNTLVIVKDEKTAPSQWLLGRVLQVHPGKDGLIRVATVRTRTGNLKRPINKLCPIPID